VADYSTAVLSRIFAGFDFRDEKLSYTLGVGPAKSVGEVIITN
jgi:hypothetical protein